MHPLARWRRAARKTNTESKPPAKYVSPRARMLNRTEHEIDERLAAAAAMLQVGGAQPKHLLIYL